MLYIDTVGQAHGKEYVKAVSSQSVDDKSYLGTISDMRDAYPRRVREGCWCLLLTSNGCLIHRACLFAHGCTLMLFMLRERIKCVHDVTKIEQMS